MSCTYDQTNKIWTAAAEEPIYNYNNSLGQILFHQLKNFSNKVIQIDDTSKTSVTGQEALTWGVRIAQKLKEQQLDHNDIVGVSARNSTYVLPVALGCFFNCTPLHCVNPSLDKDTFSYCFGITKPRIIFCDGSDYEKVHEATLSFNPTIYTVAEHKAGVPSVLDLLKPTATEVKYKPECLVLGLGQTVAILCSSGTTGKPKAVCISGPTLMGKEWMNTNESISYTPSGIDWGTGLYNFTSSCINGFTRIITNKSYNTELFVELVQKYKITTAFLSSRYVASLVQNPMATRENLSSLRKISFGGSNLSETSSKKIESLLGADVITYFGYGTTEMGCIACRIDSPKHKSVGQLQCNLSMRIVDDNGHILGHNEVGEILLKSPIPWSGYYGNTAATESTIDSQGWMSTGDLGYVDNDNDLYLVDRKKEVLKYQGLHFWPREIEEVIAELCDVRDVCVVSLSDDTCGDLAGALVVKKHDSNITEQDVIDHVKNRLVGSHKQLNAGAFFVDKLPHNPNGKLLKREAVELLKEFATNGKNLPERLVLGIGQTVAILCSSGTTGKPKAVCISGPSLMRKELMNTNESILYTPSGIDWITGLYNFTSSCINGFTRIITNKSFDSDLFLELVKKYKITSAFLSSRYVASLVQNPMATRENLSSLRKIAFGGSNLSETSSKKIESLLGADIITYFGYGTTEMGCIACRIDSPKLKSVGQIQSNISMRIVDDNGHNLGHNEVGEILLKSPIPWSGYYGDIEATESTIDSQGWISTGDLGYVDNDNNLYLVDRKKEVLKYQKLHFWPREIEEVIAELCDVREVCVVSLSDDTCGDLAGALVVKIHDSNITEQAIIDHVKKRLVGSHKQLNAGAYFVDKLPHNPNGKLLKREAVELLKEFAANAKNLQ